MQGEYISLPLSTLSYNERRKGLNRLVQAGKVLYLGISDTPAWVVAKANECM